MKKKILLLKPAYSAQGGISNYFKVLENKFSLPVDYFERGARSWPKRNGKIAEFKRAWNDLTVFSKLVQSGEYGLCQTSTSLGSLAVIRDGLFLNAAKKAGIKTIVFFRGWDLKFEKKIESYYLGLFRRFFLNADSIIVLASQFKTKLLEWGYKKPIFVETTIVDDNLLVSIDNEFIESKRLKNTQSFNLLFLARVEVAKGIYEAIDAYIILKKKFPLITFTIAGDGTELQRVKAYVAQKDIKGICFTGKVTGNSKKSVLKSADIYILPSYSEGMPNSVLEAMAFGLPVISSHVGGLVDILEDGKTGFFVKDISPQSIARTILPLIDDSALNKEMAMYNFLFARDNFMASKVVVRIEKIYNNLL